jgi:hypothetical protein
MSKTEISMSNDPITRTSILGPTDAPSVSTILEEMFQYLDGSVQCAKYKTIRKDVRLRLALTVLGEAGYAQLNVVMNPRPMVVATTKLLRLLALKSSTTDVEPLVLSVQGCISPAETNRQLQYAQAFKSALQKEL